MPKSVADTVKRVDLSTVVDLAVKEAKSCSELRGCTIVSTGAPVIADVLPTALQMALVNLILNAAEAKKRCHIVIELAELADAVHIAVHDNGPGIPPAQRARVFLPHVTSKEFNQGMGLVAVDSVAHLHGGSADVCDSAYGGACVCIRLPRSK